METTNAEDTINLLFRFKLEWKGIENTLQQFAAKSGKITRKNYDKGVIPRLFSALYEHDRGLEVSASMLTLCQPEEVPEVFGLILPPNRTEEIILLAIEKCAPPFIIELLSQLSPGKKANPVILEAAALKWGYFNYDPVLQP